MTSGIDNPPDPELAPETRHTGSLAVLGLLGAIGFGALLLTDRCHARGGWSVVFAALAVVLVVVLALGYLGSILTGGNEGGVGFKTVADSAVAIEKDAVNAVRSAVAPEPGKQPSNDAG